MSRGRAHAGLALALALGALPHLGTPPASASEAGASTRLTASAPRWGLVGRPLELRLRQSGALAGRRIDVQLFVDESRVDTVRATGDETVVAIDTAALAPGRREIRFKSGSERGALEIYLLPAATPWVAAAVAAAAVALAALLRRRGRSPKGRTVG